MHVIVHVSEGERKREGEERDSERGWKYFISAKKEKGNFISARRY